MNLLDATLELVHIDSVSRNESAIADYVHTRLSRATHLEVTRIGDNVIARSSGSSSSRVIVAGHLDTVPGQPSDAVISGDRLVGLGACDMKGSVAVMLNQAEEVATRLLNVTWIFYAREEITRSESGLLEIADTRPDLLEADAAILGEPTGGVVEAGCQGSLMMRVTLRGTRAHAARPFVGRNAIHRLGELINRIATYEPREAVIDGITYTEQLQVVGVTGGVAANVVPDEAICTLNHRVAPDRDDRAAALAVQSLFEDLLEAADDFAVVDWAPPAAPSLSHPLIAKLVSATGQPARAKAGWTDVATFAVRGTPAANFGAGDPLLAHRSDESISLSEIEIFDVALRAFLNEPSNT